MTAVAPDAATVTGGHPYRPPTSLATSLPDGSHSLIFIGYSGGTRTPPHSLTPRAVTPDPMPDISALQQDIRELRSDVKSLDKRVTDGFTAVGEKRHSQTIWLLSLYGGGVAALAVMIAKGFKWI